MKNSAKTYILMSSAKVEPSIPQAMGPLYLSSTGLHETRERVSPPMGTSENTSGFLRRHVRKLPRGCGSISHPRDRRTH